MFLISQELKLWKLCFLTVFLSLLPSQHWSTRWPARDSIKSELLEILKPVFTRCSWNSHKILHVSFWTCSKCSPAAASKMVRTMRQHLLLIGINLRKTPLLRKVKAQAPPSWIYHNYAYFSTLSVIANFQNVPTWLFTASNHSQIIQNHKIIKRIYTDDVFECVTNY